MNLDELKRIVVIQKYIEENFGEGEWAQLGTLTGSSHILSNHPRLYRAMSFGDPDYSSCIADVLTDICKENPKNISAILELFDIEEWYEKKEPKKFEKLFGRKSLPTALFWKNGYLKVFISHLATSKEKAVQLKLALLEYGMTCFVAHDDIEPTKEWMTEIELGLNTMEALVAMVEPGFKESNWTDQEIGFALAREIEIVPLRMGADPHGFLGKYQGVQAKGKYAGALALEIFKILIKKSRYQERLLSALYLVLQGDKPTQRIAKIKMIESLETIPSDAMKELLENAGLGTSERTSLATIILKHGAFKSSTAPPPPEDDLPF